MQKDRTPSYISAWLAKFRKITTPLTAQMGWCRELERPLWAGPGHSSHQCTTWAARDTGTGQRGPWLSPACCTAASTQTPRDVGEKGANEEPLQCHGGLAPPRAELLPHVGGCCPWASAEKGMTKPQVRQQVTHSKCNWHWWQGAHQF